MKGLAAAVTHQDPGEGIDSLLSGSRSGPSRLVAVPTYVLAAEPQLSEVRLHLVDAVDDLFIGSALVVDHFAFIEPVVEQRADGAFGEGLAIAGEIALGVQLLG